MTKGTGRQIHSPWIDDGLLVSDMPRGQGRLALLTRFTTKRERAKYGWGARHIIWCDSETRAT